MMEREMAADVAQVYELWNEYAAACHAGDLERWMALWTDDAIQMAPDAPQRAGKDQIREAMRPTFELFFMRNMIIDTGEVQILGDQAYSRGTYTFDLLPKDGGPSMSLSGKFLDILKRQPDGTWKMAIDCHNYNESYS